MRKVILRYLLRLDNFLRRWITYFALENGVHPKHRLTRYHQFFLDNIQKTDTVLDVGCGLGLLARDVAAKAREVTGIDINQRHLNIARRQYSRSNLTYVEGDATTYDFKERFNVLIISNTLEHIQSRVEFLRKLSSTADNFLIRVPAIDRDWLVPLKKELGVEYRLDPTHYTEYTEKSLRRELAEAGLKVHRLSIRFSEIYCVAKPDQNCFS